MRSISLNDKCPLFFNCLDHSYILIIIVCNCSLYRWCLIYAFDMKYRNSQVEREENVCTKTTCMCLTPDSVISDMLLFVEASIGLK